MEIELNMQRFQGGRNKLKQWEEELVKHVTKGQQSTSRRFAYEKIKTIIFALFERQRTKRSMNNTQIHLWYHYV